jgi:hypothetical protein
MLIVSFEVKEGQLTEEQQELVNTLPWILINSRGSKDYYEIMVNSPDDIVEIQNLFIPKEPKVNGVWNLDGSKYGYKKVKDVEGNVSIVDDPLQDEADYPFKQSDYVNGMKDLPGGGRPTVPAQEHSFYGWLEREYVG